MVSDRGNYDESIEMSFGIKQDDRFFSRLMSKETSNTGNCSSRRIFYYGEKSVAVPFMWEAQPGTPKHPLSETSLPPLTPPPSFYSSSSSSSSNSNTRNFNNHSKSKIFSSIFPRVFGSRKSLVSPSSSWPPSDLSSSSSSSNSWSFAYSSPSFSMRHHKDQSQGRISRSPLKYKCSNGFRGCYPFGNMKKRMQLL